MNKSFNCLFYIEREQLNKTWASCSVFVQSGGHSERWCDLGPALQAQPGSAVVQFRLRQWMLKGWSVQPSTDLLQWVSFVMVLFYWKNRIVNLLLIEKGENNNHVPKVKLEVSLTKLLGSEMHREQIPVEKPYPCECMPKVIRFMLANPLRLISLQNAQRNSLDYELMPLLILCWSTVLHLIRHSKTKQLLRRPKNSWAEYLSIMELH